MPYVSVTVLVSSDAGAQPQEIFQKRLRLFLTQEQILNFQKANGDGATFKDMPAVQQIGTINALILATDAPVNFKISSVAALDGIIAMKAGGLLMALDCNLAVAPTGDDENNVLINNPGAGAATITGLAGGT